MEEDVDLEGKVAQNGVEMTRNDTETVRNGTEQSANEAVVNLDPKTARKSAKQVTDEGQATIESPRAVQNEKNQHQAKVPETSKVKSPGLVPRDHIRNQVLEMPPKRDKRQVVNVDNTSTAMEVDVDVEVKLDNTAAKQASNTAESDQTGTESDLLRNINSPIPIKILQRPTVQEPSSPDPEKSPGTPSTPSPTKGKNYKLLYKEVTKRLFEQTEAANKRYLDLEADYEKLKKKYGEETRAKDARILNLQTKLGQITESFEEERADKETSINGLRKVIVDNEKSIAEMEEKIQRYGNTNLEISGNTSCHPELRKVNSDEECFRLKPKRAAKVSKQAELKCEFKDCNEKDVDLVKCCMCSTWVCEACNDVQVAKLKPIMNKCQSVFFACKTCYSAIGTHHQQNTTTMGAGDANLFTSLQRIFDNKISQLETKIEKSIENKLGNKLDTVNSLAEEIRGRNEKSSEEKKTYAGILNLPKDVRKIMQETRNDEKVELVEQEKRCQNFIIHGAEEVGNNEEEIKANDEAYLIDILKQLDVDSAPAKVIRIGKANSNKARVLKIVMPTKASKDDVMDNLRKLKGTENKFGKISVTDDYTVTERQKIKDFTEKAREQSKQDSTRVFKVRGDPKNGLRIISIKKT